MNLPLHCAESRSSDSLRLKQGSEIVVTNCRWGIQEFREKNAFIGTPEYRPSGFKLQASSPWIGNFGRGCSLLAAQARTHVPFP
jgi:hypothetical protein